MLFCPHCYPSLPLTTGSLGCYPMNEVTEPFQGLCTCLFFILKTDQTHRALWEETSHTMLVQEDRLAPDLEGRVTETAVWGV